jgi:hypothetical protein
VRHILDYYNAAAEWNADLLERYNEEMVKQSDLLHQLSGIVEKMREVSYFLFLLNLLFY